MPGSNSAVPSTRSRTMGSAARKLMALAIVAAGLSACGLVGAMVDGLKYARAV